MATKANSKKEEIPSNKFYTVIAGRFAPEELEIGKLNPTTGLPDGRTQKIQMPVGAIMIPNYSRIWGRRINDSSKTDDRSLELTDKTYRGEIEGLEWGDHRGEMIEIRYLPTSKSLDKQYQEQIQKLAGNDDTIFIEMQQGTNDYDPLLQRQLIKMLKLHSMNPENPSRDPNNTDYQFVEFSVASRKNKMQQIATRREAEAIVLDAEKDSNMLKVLANIIPNLNPKEQDEILIDKLFQRVEADPQQFLEIIQNYRKSVQEMMLYLCDEELLFLEDNEDDVHLIENTKKVKILGDAEGDDKIKKLMWIVNNLLQPNVFEAVKRMEAVKLTALQSAVN